MKERILQLIEKGYTQKQVAEKLSCAKSTVSYHLNNKDKILKRQRLKRKSKKQKLVDYKGGKCEMCGYDKCIEALEFHHIDPNEKEFTITVSKNYDLKSLKKESDKCMLVCANCHREIHSEERDRIIAG